MNILANLKDIRSLALIFELNLIQQLEYKTKESTCLGIDFENQILKLQMEALLLAPLV
jgi:hypothetical protein